MSPVTGVGPEGANHQWRKNPPGELSIDPVADERRQRPRPDAENVATVADMDYNYNLTRNVILTVPI
jgi:hypothetical protein